MTSTWRCVEPTRSVESSCGTSYCDNTRVCLERTTASVWAYTHSCGDVFVVFLRCRIDTYIWTSIWWHVGLVCRRRYVTPQASMWFVVESSHLYGNTSTHSATMCLFLAMCSITTPCVDLSRLDLPVVELCIPATSIYTLVAEGWYICTDWCVCIIADMCAHVSQSCIFAECTCGSKHAEFVAYPPPLYGPIYIELCCVRIKRASIIDTCMLAYMLWCVGEPPLLYGAPRSCIWRRAYIWRCFVTFTEICEACVIVACARWYPHNQSRRHSRRL